MLPVNILTTTLISASNTVNTYYLGVYRDENNDEAYINAQSDGVFLIAYYNGAGTYVRTYCQSYTLTSTHFSASCTDARLCTADGTPLDSVIGTFVTQGTVTKGTSVLKIKSNGHTYAKE